MVSSVTSGDPERWRCKDGKFSPLAGFAEATVGTASECTPFSVNQVTPYLLRNLRWIAGGKSIKEMAVFKNVTLGLERWLSS